MFMFLMYAGLKVGAWSLGFCMGGQKVRGCFVLAGRFAEELDS
jgi:hypothetical protein